MSAGVHQVGVIFQTRQGYLTQPSPPVSWTAAGGVRVHRQRYSAGARAIKNIVARILRLPHRRRFFYYTSGLDATPNMVIADNSTTSITLDFSDTALLAGTVADPLSPVELGECAGVIGYCVAAFLVGRAQQTRQFLKSHL